MARFGKSEKVSNPRSGLSKWELDELTTERRKQLSKYELHREHLADGLRCPLCFCLPCAIIAFILLILMAIYIVHPYQVGRSLAKTQCRYNRTDYQESWQGYCSHRTNNFVPCFKIIVNFNTTTVQNAEAVLLENEQALVHCNKCSFTYGRSNLFGKQTSCSWNSDIDPITCQDEYLKNFGVVNSSYPCYYDASNIRDVVRVLKVSDIEAALAVFIPVLFLTLWLSAFAILMYDRFRRRTLDIDILLARQGDNKSNGDMKTPSAPKTLSFKALSSSVDYGDASGLHADTPTVTVVLASTNTSTPEDNTFPQDNMSSKDNMSPKDTAMFPKDNTPKIRRKKKLPCCKSHFQFNYLDEGIILEDKPISPLCDRPLNFNYLTIDSSPTCNCSHMDSIDVLPQLGDHYATRAPSYGYHSIPRRSGKILRYLPESFV